MMPLSKTILLLVQIAFGVGLFYTCFCRLTKTDSSTRREIRWAIVLEAAAGGLVAGAPLLPILVPELNGRGALQWRAWSTPTWVWVLVLMAATVLQLSTARYWRGGVPRDFQEENGNGTQGTNGGRLAGNSRGVRREAATGRAARTRVFHSP
jgi:hypothetical protein